jgi:hypothetical protein
MNRSNEEATVVFKVTYNCTVFLRENRLSCEILVDTDREMDLVFYLAHYPLAFTKIDSKHKFLQSKITRHTHVHAHTHGDYLIHTRFARRLVACRKSKRATRNFRSTPWHQTSRPSEASSSSPHLVVLVVEAMRPASAMSFRATQ